MGEATPCASPYTAPGKTRGSLGPYRACPRHPTTDPRLEAVAEVLGFYRHDGRASGIPRLHRPSRRPPRRRHRTLDRRELDTRLGPIDAEDLFADALALAAEDILSLPLLGALCLPRRSAR